MMRGSVRVAMGLMASSALWQMPALAQDAPPAEPAAQPETQDEIVVVGLRRSIAEAIETKRNAVAIVDSISAQDIGKLPDQNVVETLSRIPGVQITRRNGEGQNFTIRGISLNTVLVNDRPFVGPTPDSSAALDVLSPDIIAAIDVFKSPTADQIEGGLGGTVNLRTKRPLDLPAGTFALRAQGQYADIAEKYGFRGSALASTRLFDDRVGVLFNVAFQKIYNEQQTQELSNYVLTGGVDGNGDGVNDPGLYRPARFAMIRLPRRADRLTIGGAVQYRPVETLEVNIEGTYNQFDAFAGAQRFQTLLNDNDVGARVGTGNTVTSGRFAGITQRPLIYYEQDRSELYVLGGNVTWTPDNWRISADVSLSSGTSPVTGNSATPIVVPRAGRTVDVTYDLLSPTDVPSYALTGNFDVNDPTNYQLSGLVDGFNTIDNDAKAARVDLVRDIGAGLLKAVAVGYRYEDRGFNTERFDAPLTLAGAVAIADTNRDGIVTANEIPGLRYTGLGDTNLLEGLSGLFPNNFLGGSVDLAALRAGFGYTPQRSVGQSNNVQQRTHALYGRVDLDGTLFGIDIRGNAGVRWISTNREALGFTANQGGFLPIRYDRSYDEFLPSATLIFELRDNLLLRVAGARVLATPPLSDLAPGVNINIVNLTGTGGNPLLNPYQADQADVSLEWYFGRANLLAVTAFTKSVKSFTSLVSTVETIDGFINANGTGNTFLITRPQNGSDGRVRGVEFNYQHQLSFLPAPFDGLGVQANYTYASSRTPIVDPLTQRTLPLPLLSKHSFSLIGYYEKGPVTARLAYTQRSGYLLNVQSMAAGGSRYIDDQNQLDGSFQLDLRRGLRLTFDAQNLLKRPEIRYDGIAARRVTTILDDRRYFLGFAFSL
ncbi:MULTISPECIES: TonB-dependent receptor [unclassified Sphingomonas]|uniref:TonB-dependent receptor n=1 Tax=unclassified Sphingomonas TaxID=196159 RepID=UPI0009E8F402|nr:MULTISPECIES: TonB-dependent receptor [unclassified Sphingomonas]